MAKQRHTDTGISSTPVNPKEIYGDVMLIPE